MNLSDISIPDYSGKEHIVFMLLGGNKGHRPSFLREAFFLLERYIGKAIVVSSVYETEPWGFDGSEPFFLNQAVVFNTILAPEQVLERALSIELYLGRNRDLCNNKELRNAKYSSRTIDIDILFYDNIVYESPELIIPHPRITERRFVLQPLCEIMPEASRFLYERNLNREDFFYGKSFSELLSECKDTCSVRFYSGSFVNI